MTYKTATTVCIDIGRFWDETKSVNSIYKEIMQKGRDEIPLSTLYAAKKGKLKTAFPNTLLSLRDLVRDMSGNQNIVVEDLFKQV